MSHQSENRRIEEDEQDSEIISMCVAAPIRKWVITSITITVITSITITVITIQIWLGLLELGSDSENISTYRPAKGVRGKGREGEI